MGRGLSMLAASASLCVVAGCGGSTVTRPPVAATTPPVQTVTEIIKTVTQPAPARTVTKTVSAPTPNSGSGLVPVNVCPSTYGVAGHHPVPSRIAASLPADVAGRLIFYANTGLAVLAPEGWECNGAVGADGSARITVAPGSQAAEAVTAQDGSACVSCDASIACPLFASAVQPLQQLSIKCPSRPPPSEAITHLSSTTVAFEDPPYVRGTGSPSGGADPANGVMIYGTFDGSLAAFAETCTLPDSMHSLCTVILNDFLNRYPGA